MTNTKGKKAEEGEEKVNEDKKKKQNKKQNKKVEDSDSILVPVAQPPLVLRCTSSMYD